MFAHFTFSDQFIGLSGSSLSGSFHHTICSGSEVGVAWGENRSGIGEIVIVRLDIQELTFLAQKRLETNRKKASATDPSPYEPVQRASSYRLPLWEPPWQYDYQQYSHSERPVCQSTIRAPCTMQLLICSYHLNKRKSVQLPAGGPAQSCPMSKLGCSLI